MNTAELTATFTAPAKDQTNGFSRSHRKETPCHLTTYTVIDPTAPANYGHRAHEVITLRVYSTAARATACVWSGEFRGSGSANGCGYHRPSAAAEVALANAGFKLSSPIEGRGDNLIAEALIACARARGCASPLIVIGHA